MGEEKFKIYVRVCIRCNECFKSETKWRSICNKCNIVNIKINKRKRALRKQMNPQKKLKLKVKAVNSEAKVKKDLLKYYQYIYTCKDCKKEYGRDVRPQNQNKNCGKCLPRKEYVRKLKSVVNVPGI